MNQYKVIVIGANGLMGREFAQYFKQNHYKVIETSHAPSPHQIKIDLLDKVDYRGLNFGGGLQPIFIICSGYSNLNLCFQNRDISEKINIDGLMSLITYIKSIDGIPIFLSSDCVFDGSLTRYKEEDKKNPISIYGKQKSEIEDFIVRYFDRYIIIRSSKVLSTKSSSWIANTFLSLEKGLPVKCFTDRLYAPVVIGDISQFISMTLSKRKYGIFNLAQDVALTPYEQAVILTERFKFEKYLVEPILMDEINLVQAAPKVSILENIKAKALVGFEFQNFGNFIDSFPSK
jgi:dTDP-4-dehydrorhamnose reductase